MDWKTLCKEKKKYTDYYINNTEHTSYPHVQSRTTIETIYIRGSKYIIESSMLYENKYCVFIIKHGNVYEFIYRGTLKECRGHIDFIQTWVR